MLRTTIAFVLISLFAVSSAAAAPLPVTAQKLAHREHSHDYNISYPQTGIVAIDREIAAWARKQVADFTAYVKHDQQEGEGAWSLGITYKIVRNDAQMFEAVFNQQMGDDGNHTHVDFTTFDYLMPDAHRVFIPEVVMRAAFPKMRAFAAAHTVSEDPDFGAEVAEGGLPPEASTFAAFTMSPSAITIWFTPEQLGNMTSAGGHATIPLAEIKGLIRPDWRAPQPSYDCAKAASAVEKTICSDVALARLDRDMAAQYRMWLQWNPNDAGRLARQRADQQAWLAARKQCGGAPSSAMAACLIRLYRMRIAVLGKPPK
jgi:uncharacterized protein YecT (DUF1311 family)